MARWRRKVNGNIGHAIETLVVEPNDTHGYHDEGWRIVCSYQGHRDNVLGMNENAHAEHIADTILTAVNSHEALVEALRLALPWVSAPLDDRDMSASAVAHRAIRAALSSAEAS